MAHGRKGNAQVICLRKVAAEVDLVCHIEI